MKKIFILILIIFAIIIAGGLLLKNQINLNFFKEKAQNPPETTFQQPEITLSINNGESVKNFQAGFQQEMTAFDLLKEGAKKLNLDLKTKTYDIGIFIELIGDKENGQDGKYWFYYVNGELAQVAADKKEIKPGDKVEFKFEKSPF